MRDGELRHAQTVRDNYQDDDPAFCLYVIRGMITRNPQGSLELGYVWFQSLLNTRLIELHKTACKAIEHGDDRYLLLITLRLTLVERTCIIQAGANHLSIIEQTLDDVYGPVTHFPIFCAACRHNAYDVVMFYLNHHQDIITWSDNGGVLYPLEIACTWGHTRVARALYESNISPDVDLANLRHIAQRNGEPFFLDE